MANLKKVMDIMILILLVAAPVLAISQNYESAATARIVGNSPADLVKQLQNGEGMDFEKAVYVGKNADSSDANSILGTMFTDFVYWAYVGYNDLNLGLDVFKDVILVINPIFSKASMEEISYLNSSEAKQLSAKLERNENLVVLNNPYSGLYLPYEDSLAGSIAPSASLIAPMSYSSNLFLKALVCNINNYDTIGEAYRQARNNYYWYTDDSSELIGLTLLSYSLYGLPTRELDAPSADLGDYCSNYLNEFSKGSAVLSGLSLKSAPTNNEPSDGKEHDLHITSATSGVYEKSFEFNIDAYSIVNEGNYSLIEANNTENSRDLFELVLPVKVIMDKFPIKTLITNVSTVEFSNPVEIIVPNLPSFNGFEYINRECYKDESEASAEFSHSYTKDSLAVLTKINPAEVLNCTEGKIRLYKTVKYKIEYIPYSPILIKEVSSPGLVLPGQEFNASLELENIQTSPVNGYLAIKDSEGNVVSAKEISADNGNYEMTMKAGEKEGFYTYRADFYYNNESLTYKEFSVIDTILEIELITPEVATSEADVQVIVFSNLNTSFQTNLDYNLIYEDAAEYSDADLVTLNPGLNTFTIEFDSLDRSKTNYEVSAGVSYSNKYKLATASLITEHVPVIIQNNLIIKENESLALSPRAYDLDGDNITLSIDYPFNYNDSWKASFESSGQYMINLTADDGIKETTRSILLSIENNNRQPVLENLSKIILKEGENVTVSLVFWDPDNNNSVSNDDNNLTISYSELFNDYGLLAADFDSSGNHTIYATVSDGKLSDSKGIEVEIQNVNRAPQLLSNSLIINENETLSLNEIIFDPDNNNSVSNDDNAIEVSTNALFDENSVWQTDFNDSGEYSVSVEYSDGEFEKNENLTIRVLNVNRAPMISASSIIKNYYISENSNLTLNISASDPDGDSLNIDWYVNNDKKTDGEEFVFNSQSQTGTYDVRVAVNDGNLTNEEAYKVVVSDMPILEGFDGETSSLNKESLETVYPFVIEKSGMGKIVFKEQVNLSESVDFVNNALINPKYVSLNSRILTALANAKARVYLYGIEQNTPIVYYNEEFGVSGATRVCPSSVCSNISYENKVLSFDVSHFSTFLVEQASGQQMALSAPNNFTFIFDPTLKSIEGTFEIINLGLADIDNLAIRSLFNPGNIISILPTSMSLPSGSSGAINAKGTITPLSSYFPFKIGDIIFENADISETTEIYAKQKAPFEISELKIEVGNEIYSEVGENDYIVIAPNDELNVKVTVSNPLSDMPVENVQIEILIEDLDIEEKTAKFDLGALDSIRKEILLKLPEVLDENEYVMTLKVSGDSEQSPEYEIVFNVNLDINKKEHEVQLGNIKFEPSQIGCNENTMLSFDLLNTGRNKEDVRITVENSELGINLEEGKTIPAGQKKSYNYNIPANKAGPGKYYFEITVYSEDDLIFDEESKKLEIFECQNTFISSTEQNIVVLNTKEVYSENNNEIIWIISLLIVLVILLTLLIVLLSKPKAGF